MQFAFEPSRTLLKAMGLQDGLQRLWVAAIRLRIKALAPKAQEAAKYDGIRCAMPMLFFVLLMHIHNMFLGN